MSSVLACSISAAEIGAEAGAAAGAASVSCVDLQSVKVYDGAGSR